MHQNIVPDVNKLIIVQNNVKPWIGNHININLYVKRNEYHSCSLTTIYFSQQLQILINQTFFYFKYKHFPCLYRQ